MSDISVVGLGSMGSALAQAVVKGLLERGEAVGYGDEHIAAIVKVLRRANRS